jgi:hypothetical protein
MKSFPFAHENLGPAGDRHDPKQVPRELGAIGNNIVRVAGRTLPVSDPRRRRPKGIALTESIGHHFPSLAHYGDPIRNRKTEGRANLALYLRNGLEGPPARWVDHRATWPKVNDPSKQHAPRATLIKELYDHGPTIVVGHAPQAPNPRLPVTTNRALVEARREWVDITVRILNNYEYVIWLGDPNFLLPDVRHALGHTRVSIGGDGTDAVLVRGYFLEDARIVSSVNGVPMMTDHEKALLGRAVKR